MFDPFYEVISGASETILKYEKDLNRPVIGVMPAYFPMELIDAAGGYAVQLWGNNLPLGKVDAYLQAYCCSVARSVLELELIGGAEMVRAYAFTSLCDTLINLREIYKRLFSKPTVELSIPITRTVEARRSYLRSVIRSVVAGLETVTGHRLGADRLAEAARIRGRTRALQQRLYQIRRERPGITKNRDFYAAIKAGFFLPPAVYNDMLETLIRGLDSAKGQEARGPRLVLSGLVFDPVALHGVLDELGVVVVDDDFANGWRTVSKGELQVEDLVEGVTKFLFDPAPCCCIYNPQNDRHPYLVNKVKEAGADGVLFWYIKFCEPDAFDRPQLMGDLKEEGIPCSVIDVELSMSSFDAVRTRINAFCEILEG